MKPFTKYHRLPLFVVVCCVIFGCAGGPVPDKAAWPWEHAKEYGNYQTGDYVTYRGNVAHFDQPPKPMQPVSPEALYPPIPGSKSAPPTPVTNTQPPSLPKESALAPETTGSRLKNGYDFTVRDVKIDPPLFLPAGSVSTDCNITAFNHGNAPVSVTVTSDPASSENIATDKPLPLNIVVPPNSERPLVRVRPKRKDQSYNFNYSYTWSIGDYGAVHNCPENYQFPFAKNVKAFASVSDDANTSTFTRYAVIFAMPVGTQVLASRKGTVVRIGPDKVDILHNDSTIATYGHLGKIGESIVAGKVVAAWDPIGVVGTSTYGKEGFMQLTVWRPGLPFIASPGTASQGGGVDFVSFPLEFCSTDSGDCRVITQNQMVPGNKAVGSRKQGSRKPKAKSR